MLSLANIWLILYSVVGTFLASSAKKWKFYDCSYNVPLKAEIGFWKKSREESLKPGTVIISRDSDFWDRRCWKIYEIGRLVGNKFLHYVAPSRLIPELTSAIRILTLISDEFSQHVSRWIFFTKYSIFRYFKVLQYLKEITMRIMNAVILEFHISLNFVFYYTSHAKFML